MRYDEFLGHVQHRARLGSRGEAERATRATLESLAERLVGGEAHDLASQLPLELAHSLQLPDAGMGAKLTLEEFFELVSEREGVELEEATLHARVVLPWNMVDNLSSPLQTHFGPVFRAEAVQRGLLFLEPGSIQVFL